MSPSLRAGERHHGKSTVEVSGRSITLTDSDFDIAERTGSELFDVLVMPLDEQVAWRDHARRNPWWGWRGIQFLLAQMIASQSRRSKEDKDKPDPETLVFAQEIVPWLFPDFDRDEHVRRMRLERLPDNARVEGWTLEQMEARAVNLAKAGN